jgi:hypothetical protein
VQYKWLATPIRAESSYKWLATPIRAEAQEGRKKKNGKQLMLRGSVQEKKDRRKRKRKKNFAVTQGPLSSGVAESKTMHKDRQKHRHNDGAGRLSR